MNSKFLYFDFDYNDRRLVLITALLSVLDVTFESTEVGKIIELDHV